MLINEVELMGKVLKNFEFSHECFGEKFYTIEIEVKRTSGASDIITLLCSDRVVDVDNNIENKYISITGNIRTHNLKTSDRSRLLTNIYVNTLDVLEGIDDNCIGENNGIIEGYICKRLDEPRETPLGRKIMDFIIASNRNYGKTDYIPCVAWGKNAKYISTLPIGTKISISGRFQSRTYYKNDESHLVNEMSIQTIELMS